MRKFEGKKKLLSVLLCLCMVLGYLPTPTAAAENGLCAHHETHDEECGFAGGQPCGHVCTEECQQEEVKSCQHTCMAETCAWVDAVEAVNCGHVCGDGSCSYAPATDEAEGVPCNYHSETCGCQPAMEAHWDCNHECTKDSGCITYNCLSHVCPAGDCGYAAAGQCTYALNGCAECEEEAKKIADGPQVPTISAWSWNDEYEILSADGTYATLPHAADWETLKSVLPASVTATVDGEEVEIPVEWECETFPAEGEGQGTYELKAILPEGYALGEDVAVLELEVDLGVAEQLDDPTVDTSWHNTTANSFTLTTAAQLAGLAQLVNDGTDSFSGDTISLGGNLDLSGYANWTPIGKNSSYSFKGTFDGAGKTIANLTIDSAQQYVGMFGYVNGGTIKNVVLEKPNVTTSYSSTNASVGALVGYHSGTGNIEYCAVRNGSVSAPNSTCANTYSGLGGVVGCHNTSGNVIGCYNYMTAVSTNGNTMTRCGGVAGSVQKMAKSCYTYNTNQKGIPVVGGYASGSGTTAQYSAYLKADGAASSSISWSSYSVALSEEEFANGIAAYYLRTGAYSEFDTASHSPWGQDVEGDTTDPMPVWNGTAVYQMQWVQNVNGTGTVITDYVNELETKEIDGVTYRVIHDAYDWVLFANLVNSNNGNPYPNRGWNAIVEPAGATIDFSVLGTLAYHNGSWQKVVTIGTSNGPYNGIFNGNGCTITGLNYESAYNYGAYALFGYTGADAYISNITVKNANLNSTSNHYLATFVREHKGTLENCHAVTVDISCSNSSVGGIAYNNAGTIRRCSFSGSVTSGGNAGGIASSASSGAQFIKCWNSGAVSGKTIKANSGNYAGGILAQEANGVTINNCYNTGNITGYYAGGIVGSRYSNYTTTITNCHSYGATLTGTTTYPIANVSMTNCYYLADSETDNVNGTTFKTAAEFKDGTVLNLLNSGNTETVWYQYVDYPILEQKEIPHQHVWTCTLNEAHDTITATCDSTDGMTCAYSGQTLSMTISALGGAYTKEAYTAALDGNLATALGLTSANIQYEYKASADGTYAAAANTKDAGYYKASITAGEGDGAKTAYVEFVISKVEITENMVTLSNDTFVYDGETKTVTVTVKVNADTVLTKNTDYTVSGTTTASALSTGNGYAVTVNGIGNYTGEVTKYWTITKAKPTITEPPTIGTITYGETLADASLDGGVASVDGSFAFQDKTIAPTVADSNSTEYTLVFTPTDEENYDPVEIKVKVTVNPKEIGITWGTTEFTYDGNAKLPTASVTESSAINSDQLGLTVELVETTEGAGTNAGTYTAKVTGITGEKAANYKLPENVTTSFEIKNASQAAPQGLVGNKETVLNKADGTITGLTTDMEWSKEGNGTYTAVTDVNMTFAAGTYYVRYKAKDNHDASPATAVTIAAGDPLTITVPGEQTAYSLTADKTTAGWHDDVTITFALKPGYSVDKDFAVTVNGQEIELDTNNQYKIQNVEANVTVTVTGIADTTPPTVAVTLEDNWNTLWNGITFGKFFKETKTFTITAADQETGINKVYYHLAEEELTEAEVKATDLLWTEYDLNGSGVSVNPDKVFIIYAKAVDNAGNITYVNSDGIVLDETVPVITGVTNGATYYTTQKVTATDSAISGTSTLQSLTGTNADGTIPGDPAQETKHTIVATDKAGNTTTFEITMKPISSLAAGLPTEDTVKLTDKETIETIKKNVSDVLTNQSANATDAEKDKLEDIIAQCNDLLNQIKKAEDVIALIQALPDASKVEPDDKTAIDAYDAALAAYNALTDNEKSMVGEENKAKLDAVGKALTDYKIIKGNKSSYVKGSNKTLSFTANGYFGKFTGVEVDGKLIDAKYYSAESGSTIITLKSSYLETLSSGKHTIQVNYTDGHTSGEDYFRVTLNNGSPITGDNSHILLLGGVAMTSLLCMAMMMLFFLRKKGKYQR